MQNMIVFFVDGRAASCSSLAVMDYWTCSPAVVQFLRRSFETLLIKDNKVNASASKRWFMCLLAFVRLQRRLGLSKRQQSTQVSQVQFYEVRQCQVLDYRLHL